MPNPICKQCNACYVEDERADYATPVCFACLPKPRPLNTAWSMNAELLVDLAEALGHVRGEDSAPLRLTPAVLLDLVRALRDNRDHWRNLAQFAARALIRDRGC
jgi:hypothetical protein